MVDAQRTRDDAVRVQLAVRPGPGQRHPLFNAWLQATLRHSGGRFDLPIMAQAWIAGAVPPGHSVIFHVSPPFPAVFSATGSADRAAAGSRWTC